MRRLIAAGAAIIMAMIGALLLLAYVRGADQRANARALADVQTAPVLVATGVIPKGTSGDKLGTLVTVKRMPRMAIANGAVSDNRQLSGKLATVDIQQGEQVLSSRFAAPGAQSDVDVPAGMEQVSLLLPLERTVGGLVAPGTHVGVWRAKTQVADNVLVTHIDNYAKATADSKSSKSASTTQPAADSKSDAPSDAAATPDIKVMVTLAMTPQQVQAYVAGIEGDSGSGQPPGEIWLSLDKDATYGQ